MPLASYVLSLCLHIAAFLLIWLWPAGQPLVDLQKPVMISLVDGAPGGNKTPSPILGPMGHKAPGESAPTPPAKKADVAQTEREETKVAPIEAPKDTRPQKQETPQKPELKPKPQPAPKPESPEKAVSPKKRDQKPEPPKEKKPDKQKSEDKPTKDTQTKKNEKKSNESKSDTKETTSGKDKKNTESKARSDKDAIASALNQARRGATSRADSGNRGSSVEQALAEARRNAGGNRGGGGGEGSGPGGGGLNSVYIGQVMLAVRPNWGYASGGRKNMQCTVHITVSKSGEVKTTQIISSSGNAQYDSSCVNAIMRTSKAGDFPPPPTPMYQELDLVFTLGDMLAGGR